VTDLVTGAAVGGVLGAAGGYVAGRFAKSAVAEADAALADDTAAAITRAKEINNALDSIAAKNRTVAVLNTEEGPVIVASGKTDLSLVQRQMLTNGEIPAKLANAHAEITAIEQAKALGLTPTVMGTSRSICSNCELSLAMQGWTLTSPNSAVFGAR